MARAKFIAWVDDPGWVPSCEAAAETPDAVPEESNPRAPAATAGADSHPRPRRSELTALNLAYAGECVESEPGVASLLLVIQAVGYGDLAGIEVVLRIEDEASGRFSSGHPREARCRLRADGTATVPHIVAGGQASGFKLTVCVPDFPEVAGLIAVHTVRLELAGLAVADGIDRQHALAGEPFASMLAVRSFNRYRQGVPGVEVDFAIDPAEARGAHFPNRQTAATAISQADGIATAPLLIAGESASVFTVRIAARLAGSELRRASLTLYVDPPGQTARPDACCSSLDAVGGGKRATTRPGRAFRFADLGQFRATRYGRAEAGLAVTLTLMDGDGADRRPTGELKFIVHGEQVDGPLVRITDGQGLVHIPPVVSVGKSGRYSVQAKAANGDAGGGKLAIGLRPLQVEEEGGGTAARRRSRRR